jgi:hypothetical protein
LRWWEDENENEPEWEFECEGRLCECECECACCCVWVVRVLLLLWEEDWEGAIVCEEGDGAPYDAGDSGPGGEARSNDGELDRLSAIGDRLRGPSEDPGYPPPDAAVDDEAATAAPAELVDVEGVVFLRKGTLRLMSSSACGFARWNLGCLKVQL